MARDCKLPLVVEDCRRPLAAVEGSSVRLAVLEGTDLAGSRSGSSRGWVGVAGRTPV